LNLSGLEHIEPLDLGDYLIDRFEVTNREYKKFVDAGGYQHREFWKHSFMKNGKSVTWEQAMGSSRTKRADGPRRGRWELPLRPVDFPVAGVSWYEAEAYAALRGKVCRQSSTGTERQNLSRAPTLSQ